MFHKYVFVYVCACVYVSHTYVYIIFNHDDLFKIMTFSTLFLFPPQKVSETYISAASCFANRGSQKTWGTNKRLGEWGAECETGVGVSFCRFPSQRMFSQWGMSQRLRAQGIGACPLSPAASGRLTDHLPWHHRACG